MTHEEAKGEILAREAVRNVVLPSTEADLRQQLADVSNERDGFKQELNRAHCEVGQLKKDAGKKRSDLTAERDALQIKLNASEALLRQCMTVFNSVSGFKDQRTRTAWYAEKLHPTRDAVVAFLVPSSPAKSTAPSNQINDLPDGPLTDEGTKAPATDEQGAGA